MEKEYALVLEGGGAKCAYQAGAILSLLKHEYSFNAISGASFGAFNGAMLISGGINRLLAFYNEMTVEKMFNDPGLEQVILENQNNQSNVLPAAIKYCLGNLVFQEHRHDIASDYYQKIYDNINVNVIKNSPIDFYCTVLRLNNNPLVIARLFKSFATKESLNELYETREIEGRIITKDDNPLDEFIAASANYPVHPPLKINGQYYYDGGIYDNSPYKHLIEKGYKKIIIIRTHNDKPLDIEPDNKNIIIITPRRNLGSSLSFTKENIQELMRIGYLDTERILNNIDE